MASEVTCLVQPCGAKHTQLSDVTAYDFNLAKVFDRNNSGLTTEQRRCRAMAKASPYTEMLYTFLFFPN